MKGIWIMLFGDRTPAPTPLEPFLRLYGQASDSVCDQDALVEFYEGVGMIGGGFEITDDEARRTFDSIMADERLGAVEKDAYLDALDVAVQNHHSAGMAAEIMNEIHLAQGWLVMNGGE